MLPQGLSARRFEAMQSISRRDHQLIFTVEIDDQRRSGRDIGKLPGAPDNFAVTLSKGNHTLLRCSNRRDNQVAIGNRACGVARLYGPSHLIRQRVELFYKAVRPDKLPGLLV